jgi:hypothetical protein
MEIIVENKKSLIKIGTFCNCFFQDEDFVSKTATMHDTEIERDGTCCWCGYYAVVSIKERSYKQLDIGKLKYRNKTRYKSAN